MLLVSCEHRHLEKFSYQFQAYHSSTHQKRRRTQFDKASLELFNSLRKHSKYILPKYPVYGEMGNHFSTLAQQPASSSFMNTNSPKDQGIYLHHGLPKYNTMEIA